MTLAVFIGARVGKYRRCSDTYAQHPHASRHPENHLTSLLFSIAAHLRTVKMTDRIERYYQHLWAERMSWIPRVKDFSSYMRKRLFKIALLAFMIHSANSETSTYKSEIHLRYFEFNKNKGTPFFKAIKKDAPATSMTTEQTGKIVTQ